MNIELWKLHTWKQCKLFLITVFWFNIHCDLKSAVLGNFRHFPTRCLQDINYTVPLVIPPLGLELRTNIYVQVQAVNLTDQ